MTNRRSRDVRELMAQTGMNYTRAARELDRRKHETQSASAAALTPRSRTASAAASAGIVAAQQRMADQYDRVAQTFAHIEKFAVDSLATRAVEGIMAAQQRMADQYDRVAQTFAHIEKFAVDSSATRAVEGIMAAQQRMADQYDRVAQTFAEVERVAEQLEQYAHVPESAISAFEAVQRAADQYACLSVEFLPPSL